MEVCASGETPEMGERMVSIVIPLWNHCEDLTKPCVERILKCGGNFELILVDNASTDGTREYISNLNDKRVKVVFSKINTGFGGGHNLGYAKATGDSVVFLSNDVLMGRLDWIRLFEKEAKYHPNALMGPMLVTENTLTDFRYRQTPYINGFCVFATKKLFDSILIKGKVWDENFGKAYFEDVDLSVRAVRAGYELYQIPDTGLNHLISKSSDQINIPDQFTHTQKVFRSKMYEYERGDKLRIVFYCPSNYKFSNNDYEGKGVGGAEASLILFSRELAKRGYIVDVYNATEVEEKSGGVWYHNTESFDPDDYCDIFILFRTPYRHIERVNTPLKIFWSCDQHTSRDWNDTILPYVDKVIAISAYHKEYLLRHYNLDEDDILILDLGINESDYSKGGEKERFKMIFCSVPMRGLKYLAEMFPEIKRQVPEATLVITSDYRLWGAPERNAEFRAMFSGIPGVTFLGKVSREELVKEQLTSRVMAYPCEYDENFCIAAMECMAAGTVPVTTNVGALATTVGKEGIIINEMPDRAAYKEQFISWVVRLLKRDNEWIPLSESGKHRALTFYNWSYLTDHKWLVLLLDLYMEKKQVFQKNKCQMCGKNLPNAFEFFKHRAKDHVILPDPVPGVENPVKVNLKVKIVTRKVVELSINTYNWVGKELIVPYDMASEVVRILTSPNGYWGKDIIESQSVIE